MKVENPDVFINYFRRVNKIRQKWGIINEDFYNINEYGCAIGDKHLSRIIVLAEEKDAFIKIDGNRDWVIIIKYINAAGRATAPFLIFKKASLLKDLYDIISDSLMTC